jgi:hypothetical protein
MALSNGMIATMTATAVAASAATWFAANSRSAGSTTPGDGPGEPATVAAAQESTGVTVCVGVNDRILRVPPAFATDCPEGQEELDLEDDDEEVCELCDPFDDRAGDPRADDPAIAALQDRIRKLENTSYFEVVSQKDERTIFSIKPGGARFFNRAGEAVAAVGTNDGGGFFTARSPAGMEASIGASGEKGGVVLFDNGNPTVELGTRTGPHALRFRSSKGLIAGLGQSGAGTGAVLIGNAAGVTQGSITVTDGRPVVAFSKDGGPGGTAFAEAKIGGGLLEIGMARGDSAVKMGHNGHRYGIVLAGPVLGAPLWQRSGLPGSYFMGCAGGEKPACIPEVGRE